ncbi:MAG: hypothetical protein FWH11_15335 [Micrococcales bacterium]|nr:hypothetical protein [Micrococcales bacterium]
MRIAVDPDAVRRAWDAGVVVGAERLVDCRDRHHGAARGVSMAGLDRCLTDAVGAVTGAVVTVGAVCAELGEGVEACLATWQATQGQTVGELKALQRGLVEW